MTSNAFEVASACQAYRAWCEDRAEVFVSPERIILVVADGAGGSGAGAIAAESLVREVGHEFSTIHSANDWVRLLSQIDARIGEGETTAVVVDIRPYGIAGASVGDSRAVIFDGDLLVELTSKQIRKPLLGSRNALPVGFTYGPLSGVLLAGTDGYFNYAKDDATAKVIFQTDFLAIPRKCIEAVRLPSGDYWDDVALIAVRRRPAVRTRKKYEI